jgi:hypothetical protein
MIRAVYDCNVILSGIGWNGSARKCLKLVAERRVFLFVTDEILAEYEAVIPETLAEEVPEVNPHPLRSFSDRVPRPRPAHTITQHLSTKSSITYKPKLPAVKTKLSLF